MNIGFISVYKFGDSPFFFGLHFSSFKCLSKNIFYLSTKQSAPKTITSNMASSDIFGYRIVISQYSPILTKTIETQQKAIKTNSYN